MADEPRTGGQVKAGWIKAGDVLAFAVIGTWPVATPRRDPDLLTVRTRTGSEVEFFWYKD